MKNLFKEFENIAKQEWLAKVEKDLKGKPLESLNWTLSDGIMLSPFAHSEDLKGSPIAIPNNRHSNQWNIGVRIKVSNFKQANKAALSLLENGATALYFELEQTPNHAELSELLHEINLEWISINFKIHQPSWERITSNFIKIIKEKGENPSEVRCSFQFKNNDISDMEAFKNVIQKLPKAQLLTIPSKHEKDAVSELSKTIFAANKALIQLNEKGFDLKNAHKTIQFSIELSDNYFLNIAKIRALKLLWQNILSAWDKDLKNESPIQVHLSTLTQTDDENYNKIKATSQAMSAVIGGADTLYIHASDEVKDGKGTAFGQRIALNIQNLMQLESYMNRVADPAAGSYFIEGLTEQLAEAAWSKFQNEQINK